MLELLEKYNTDFEDWLNDLLTHTQAHFREGRLGTIIELEVGYIIKDFYLKIILNKITLDAIELNYNSIFV